VTYTLIALNVLIFIGLLPLHYQPVDPSNEAARSYAYVLQEERGAPGRAVLNNMSAYDAVVFRYGFKPASPSPFALLTSMFLHGGFLHLIGNMLFLWIYGDNVEDRLGRLGFLIAYLGTGAAAAFGDMALRWDSSIPSVGASGAISGVLGFYFIWFPRNRVRVFVFLFPLLATVIELSARLVLGFYLVVDNLLPLLMSGGSGGIAYGAHIGGFVAAVGAAVALDRIQLGRPEREFRRPARAAPGGGGEPAGEPGPGGGGKAFSGALERGDLRTALEKLLTTPRQQTRQQIPVSEKVRLGEELARQRHPRAALTAYQRALSDHPGSGDATDAHLGAARVLMTDLGMPTAAYQHLYAALEEAVTEEQQQKARELLEQLQRVSGAVPRQRRKS
jgi:membrane associated rhomboid family serine protease